MCFTQRFQGCLGDLIPLCFVIVHQRERDRTDDAHVDSQAEASVLIMSVVSIERWRLAQACHVLEQVFLRCCFGWSCFGAAFTSWVVLPCSPSSWVVLNPPPPFLWWCCLPSPLFGCAALRSLFPLLSPFWVVVHYRSSFCWVVVHTPSSCLWWCLPHLLLGGNFGLR